MFVETNLMLRSSWVCALFAALSVTQNCGHADTNHRFLVADSSKQRIALIDEDGTTMWEAKIGPLHDLHYLPDGKVLYQKNWTHLVEQDVASGAVLWEYDSAKSPENVGRKIEVHAFQRLDNGRTMIVESGASRIIEVSRSGQIVFEMPLVVSKSHPHRDTRLVRKLANGNYLVCHEGDAVVREYQPGTSAESNGRTVAQPKIVWEYEIPLFGKSPAGGHGLEAFGNQCYAALRLGNGNTLISTGNGHSIIEVTPAKEIVWKIEQNDLPNIQLAWVTTLQRLPNGNTVIGNCHATEANPQIVEVTPKKQIVWQFQDFDRFGNALTNTQILSTNGDPITAMLGRDR